MNDKKLDIPIIEILNKKINELIEDNEQDIYIPLYVPNIKHKKILVLSGGGIKGIALIGALNALQQLDMLQHIHTYAGTSIGALILFLINIGYTPDELYEFIKIFDLSKLKSFNMPTFLKTYGLDNGDKIEKTLLRFMSVKKIPHDITLQQLYEKTQKTLLITVVNVNERRTEYFSHNTHPNISVLLAVRMSISIPFIFTPVKFNECFYVDGGCIDNFPYRQFDHVQEDVLGICITEPSCKKHEITNIEDYAINVMYSVIYGFAEFINPIGMKNIICIEIGDVAPITFDLSLVEKNKLHDIGYNKIYTHDFVE